MSQDNSDSLLLAAYAELKQQHADLKTINQHLQFRLNRANDPNFKMEERLAALENDLKSKREEVVKLKELRQADGLDLDHYRVQVEKLRADLNTKDQEYVLNSQAMSEKILRLERENKVLIKNWSDNSTLNKIKQDNEVLINLCIETLQGIISGKVPTNIIVEYESEQSSSL